MIENGKNDPEILVQMAEELANEEFTPETMAKMEQLEIALTSFLEETSAALLERGQQDGQSTSTFETNENQSQSQWQERDLAANLSYAKMALEFLQQRLRQEEEALLQAEWALPQESFENEPEPDIYDEDVLLQAEEALRKSRDAAEKRRLEAERRSLTAARVSAGFRQRQVQNQQPEQDVPVMEPFGEVNPYEEEIIPFENQDDKYDDVPYTSRRPTIELRSLTQEDPPGETFESADTTGEGFDPTAMQQAGVRDPESLPIIYNWVQDEEGCISGSIRGSSNFKDGAKISTSPVPFGARGGATVATASGSRYFLEERTDDGTPQAPAGVPTVKRWEYAEGGGIVGLIYGSPYADDGDYIETSPIVDGVIDDYSVVSTRSGSRYFLSGDAPEQGSLDDALSAFRDDDARTQNEESDEPKAKQGTITLPKMRPRSTFSLSDLFGGNSADDTTQQKQQRRPLSFLRNDDDDDVPPQPLPPPTPDKVPPAGTPALTGCVFNKNKTITGYIFGSPKIVDGTLVTTSPVRDGERKQFEMVTTVSGSVYYLG
eukprot:CAMPEP_0197191022 /NCGR_PEP_ID=MMETSP1423-20130617/22649_1 /TAXON_ID=476441 /ORGANISM="Pseudo-nitzschia heimii, Strain UNC1101" /LENGTH=545 /DNA_ID=CAMNT_0042643549 /DNA_START=282 /DNA_END=1919 /DNA_ORIENTATION=+